MVTFLTEEDFQNFIEGHESVLEKIFHCYYKVLVSFSMRHGLEQMEAEDIVIEVIQRIWQIRKKVTSSSSLHSLLYTSVHNRTLNVIRNIKNRQRILESQRYVAEDVFCELLLEEEVGNQLYNAINVLPQKCQEVILFLLAERSVAEIAVEMNISVSTVKTYKARAIEALRNYLKDEPILLYWIIFKID